MGTTERELDAALAAQLRGTLIARDDAGYDDARAVFNGMIDKRPEAIVRCADVADVVAAVGHARDNGRLLSVRGGGHNAGGLGVADDALVIDLSRMRGAWVDPAEQTVLVQGGATWGDVDHVTHAYGAATPSGIISTTGVGGLTLGGGIGHLSRKYGLSIDNLIWADVVLADGHVVRASADENPDLYWALRGGGGNFGVVTTFKFRLHPVSTVMAGPTFWPLDMAADVMRFWDDYIRRAPREMNGFFLFLTVPPADPFPPELQMKKMCGVVWCWSGAPEDFDEVFAPVRRFGPPAMDGVAPAPHPGLQSAFDPIYPPGLQWYWRADFVDGLSDAAIAAHVEHGTAMPTWQSSMHLYPIDGAVHDVAPDETAFRYRRSQYAQVIVGVDPDPAKADELRDWTVGYYDALHPYGAGGAYVNFMMEEGEDRIRATYGDNYARLAAVKGRYDPRNLFRVNQNIRPEL